MTTTDTFWHWRGFTIWFFDGAYDVHRKGDPQPLIEGLPTVEEARAFIRSERIDDAFFKMLRMQP